jgi:hypothetical protein
MSIQFSPGGRRTALRRRKKCPAAAFTILPSRPQRPLTPCFSFRPVGRSTEVTRRADYKYEPAPFGNRGQSRASRRLGLLLARLLLPTTDQLTVAGSRISAGDKTDLCAAPSCPLIRPRPKYPGLASHREPHHINDRRACCRSVGTSLQRRPRVRCCRRRSRPGDVAQVSRL